MTFDYKTEFLSLETDFGQVFTAESKSGWEFVTFVPNPELLSKIEVVYRKARSSDFREHI